MTGPDLFDAETATLNLARNIFEENALHAEVYRNALGELTRDYERLLREMRRLIRRSDLAERDMNELNTRLQHLTAQLNYKARHDALTGVLNRGAVFEQARLHLKDAPLSMIVLDIDLFKRINDEFGHPAGDSVLIELVTRLTLTINNAGEIGRIGGEEFMILLPDFGIAKTIGLAEKIRSAIADKIFSSLPSRHVTASFGVSHSYAGGNVEDAYIRADQALYKAKRSGRNRVEKAAECA